MAGNENGAELRLSYEAGPSRTENSRSRLIDWIVHSEGVMFQTGSKGMIVQMR